MKTVETTKANPWGLKSAPRAQRRTFGKCGFRIAVILLPILCLQPVWSVTLDPVDPPPGASGLNAPPEMKVWLQGLTSPNAILRFYRRVSPPAIRPDFTIAVIGDTQFYTGSYNDGPPNKPEIFTSQTDWIVGNRQSRNIVFTAHLGDMILRAGYVEAEWTVATDAMYRLENPITTQLPQGMPYSIAVATHDGYGEYKGYNQRFGVSRFSGRSYYGGNFGANNNNHYSIFSASGMDFMVLSLEEDAGSKPGVMDWANSVLAANVSRRAIVLSHRLLYPGGDWDPAGKKIYESIKGNPNVFLMLCGHAPQIGRRTDTYEGHSIQTVLADYENEPNGGNGWMRILKFVPSLNQIQVQTYSPWLNQYKRTVYHEFNMAYNMAIPDPAYSLVATKSVTADGIVNFGIYPELEKATTYDWYVTAEVQGVVTKSAVWSFSTASDYSLIKYPAVAASPSFSDPIILEGVFQTASGYPAVIWKSKGGRRYRVEYRNESGSSSFIPIVRSFSLETDPAPAGTDSYQVFVDDGTLTGGLSTARQYQVREMAPVKPLEIIRVSKPLNGNPAIMWHSVGGRRYRVEYSNGGGSGLEFREVVRSQAAETDPAPEGSASFQTFVDDGTLTGGTSNSRFYRVREVP